MPIVIEPLPENERHRRDIEGQVARYLASGGSYRGLRGDTLGARTGAFLT